MLAVPHLFQRVRERETSVDFGRLDKISRDFSPRIAHRRARYHVFATRPLRFAAFYSTNHVTDKLRRHVRPATAVVIFFIPRRGHCRIPRGRDTHYRKQARRLCLLYYCCESGLLFHSGRFPLCICTTGTGTTGTGTEFVGLVVLVVTGTTGTLVTWGCVRSAMSYRG